MATKKELIKRCEELGIDTKPLTTNALLEEAIQAKETELAEAETSAEENAEATSEASEAAQDQPAETSEKTEEDTTEATSDASEATSEEDPSEEEEETEEEEVVVPSYEDDRGRKWRFKPSAPKTLNIDGHPMTQQEILETEEVVSELVYGNSAHLTQILD